MGFEIFCEVERAEKASNPTLKIASEMRPLAIIRICNCNINVDIDEGNAEFELLLEEVEEYTAWEVCVCMTKKGGRGARQIDYEGPNYYFTKTRTRSLEQRRSTRHSRVA